MREDLFLEYLINYYQEHKTINDIYNDSNYIVSGNYLINSANKKEAYF